MAILLKVVPSKHEYNTWYTFTWLTVEIYIKILTYVPENHQTDRKINEQFSSHLNLINSDNFHLPNKI